MYDAKQMNAMIISLFTESEIDYNLLSNPLFIKQLRSHCIETITLMLYKLNMILVSCEDFEKIVSIKQYINQPNPETGVNLLEYCIVAGINTNNIILKVTMLGASSERLDYVKSNHGNYLRNAIEIFDKCIDVGLKGIKQYNALNLRHNNLRTLDRFKHYLYRRRVAIIFALLGLGCCIAMPLTIGMSILSGSISLSPVLFTLAIGFGITSALTSYLSHVNLDERLELNIGRSRISLESNELNSIIRIAETLADKLEKEYHDKLNLCKNNTLNHQELFAITSPLLFRFTRLTDNVAIGKIIQEKKYDDQEYDIESGVKSLERFKKRNYSF